MSFIQHILRSSPRPFQDWRVVRIATACLWAAAAPSAIAQHAHIYAGAPAPTPGTALFFQNADVWDTNSYGGFTQSPACLYFESNYPAVYPGLYQTATTFVALPATIFTGGPSPFAAGLGSFLELRFVSLQGPTGGALTVWNEIDDPTQPAPLLTLPVGTPNGTNRINLSEGDPLDRTADPYGHIHGRRFTLNQPGLYTLGLQLVDTSRNGPNGGPVHRASALTYFYLQAGLALSDASHSNQTFTARFGLPGFADYALEASSNLTENSWTIVTNIPGSTHSELRWIRDLAGTAPRRFYRLRQTN